MRFGLFYEHQLPRPWEEKSELQLIQDALDQIELADKLGFTNVWEVEHHFLEEYSHSSAPEVFLAAASQRTTNMRLGHGIVLTAPGYNHPARIAERIAMLDLVSKGRVEFGSGESGSLAELGGFNLAPALKREMWREGLEIALRCMTEVPFGGVDGKYVKMPPRNVVPKPVQKPHPPVWVACSRRETILLAAECGIGALTFSFIDPEEAVHWVGDYRKTLAEKCVPVGSADQSRDFVRYSDDVPPERARSYPARARRRQLLRLLARPLSTSSAITSRGYRTCGRNSPTSAPSAATRPTSRLRCASAG